MKGVDFMKIKLKDVQEFKKLLVVKGFSVRGYGRAIDISPAYAQHVANGQRNPGPEVARKTYELLDMNFDDIFFIDYACKSNQKKQAI